MLQVVLHEDRFMTYLATLRCGTLREGRILLPRLRERHNPVTNNPSKTVAALVVMTSFLIKADTARVRVRVRGLQHNFIFLLGCGHDL